MIISDCLPHSIRNLVSRDVVNTHSVQSRKVVYGYFISRQILPFSLERQTYSTDLAKCDKLFQ